MQKIANYIENVNTVTWNSNGMDRKSNGMDSNGMDIFVVFKQITRLSEQTRCCPQ